MIPLSRTTPNVNDIDGIQSRRYDDKYDRRMEGTAIWGGFYREYPDMCAKEYLGCTWLKPFQSMILRLAFHYTYLMILASRGLGKSLLAGLIIVLKCILYPGIEIVIVAGVRQQSLNTLNKIIEFLYPRSANLRNEILEYKNTPSDAWIKFKNGSIVKVVTASDTARSFRANLIIYDEFRMIKKTILDTVLRKFKAGARHPEFKDLPEYKDYPLEPNGEIYFSSPYYCWNWSYAKFKAFVSAMLKGRSYCVLGFPYQLPIREGYYPKTQVQDEMSESDFDPIAFSMEMECLWYGESEKAFFSYEELDNARQISKPLYPRSICQKFHKLKSMQYRPKQPGEVRLLCIDVALMGGRKNDASCFSVIQLFQNGTQYQRELTYMCMMESAHTLDQALHVFRLYYDLDCDYIVIDAQGVGAGVADMLFVPMLDSERGEAYPAFKCCNNPEMAARCREEDAVPAVYAIKASAQWNSDCATNLRDALRRGKFKMLIGDSEANDIWFADKTFSGLEPEEQALILAPYRQVQEFIYETVNLSYDVVNGKVQLHEQSSNRKDRYSSVSYGNAVANELERQLHDDIESYGYMTFIN